MRNTEEMLSLIQRVALKLQVKAVAMNGSRANLNAPKDKFQDYDIVYFVNTSQMKQLIQHRDWLDNFGKQLIMQVPGDFEPDQITYDEFFTFLMLFEDGNRIDLGLCPINKIKQWQANDPVGSILYDPKHILPTNLLTNGQTYYQKKPSQLEFDNCCNEFWWVSTYVVKGLVRKELFYASDHFYQNCFQEYLKMVSYLAASNYNYQIDVGKNHKYLLKYVQDAEAKRIRGILNLHDFNSIKKALLTMQKAFNDYASIFAYENNYQYDQLLGERITRYSMQQLNTN